MSSPRLTLYTDAFWISPYVFSCWVALSEKGLAFETAQVALHAGDHRRPDYRDRSLTARVPALDHDGFWIAESSAIVEYVDEAFAAPDRPRLLPEGAHERARCRQIMSWLRSDLGALRDERPTSTMFYADQRAAAKPLTAAGEAAAEKLLRVADLLVREAATPLFGPFSVADADLAFMLHRLLLNGHEVKPKLRAYAEAQWARPSVQAFVVRERPPYVPY